jgi:hypothetical protein
MNESPHAVETLPANLEIYGNPNERHKLRTRNRMGGIPCDPLICPRMDRLSV